MKKTTSKKKYLLLSIFFFLFLSSFFLFQFILKNKNYYQTKQDLRISLIKIFSQFNIIDITKFYTEDDPSFFNKSYGELLSSSFIFNLNKKKPEKIFLNIKPKYLKKIYNDIENARKTDVFLNDNDNTIPAEIFYKNEKIFSKIRIKGAHGDHWNKNERFSLKINLKKGKTIFDNSEFVIQNFNTLFYLEEAIFSNILNFFDLYTPKIKIVDIYLNGNHWGPMVFKEHYSEDFLENRRDKNFNLYKFYDDTKGVNYTRLLNNKYKDINKKLIKGINDTSFHYFSKYTNSNENKKFYDSILSSLIDSRKFKKFINHDHIIKLEALRLVLGIDMHAYQRANLRVFYNDYEEKFYFIPTEPWSIRKITINDIYDSIGLLNYLYSSNNEENILNLNLVKKKILSYDKIFTKKLFLSLNSEVCKFTNEDCKNNLNDKYEIIKFNFFNVSRLIDKKISLLEKKMNKKNDNRKIYDDIKTNNENYNLIKQHFHLRVFKGFIDLRYYFPYKLKLLSMSIDGGKKIFIIEKEIKEKQNTLYFPFLNDELNGETVKIKYSIDNAIFEKTFFIEDKKYYFKNILNNEVFNIPSFIIPDGQNYIVKQGKWTIKEPLVLINRNLIIEPNVTLEFINNSYLSIFNGNIVAIGKKNDPIYVKFDKNLSNGIKVVGSKKSILKNIFFKNLSNFKNNFSLLDGGINFYKSNVIIENCNIEDSISNDVINFVKTNFKFIESSIINTIGDGIDSDFSEGIIKNSLLISPN